MALPTSKALLGQVMAAQRKRTNGTEENQNQTTGAGSCLSVSLCTLHTGLEEVYRGWMSERFGVN